MNIPLDRKLCPPTRPLPAAAMEEATVIAMGAALGAVFFDRPAGRRERMGAEQDGQPIPRPFITAELPLRSGGSRHVLFVPQDIDTLLSRRLVLRLEGAPVAEIDPAWLQLPRGDLAALTAQLSPQGLHRLLRVMLTTGASLFAGQAQAGLADAALRLAEIGGIPALAPAAKTDAGGRALVSYAVPGLPAPGALAEAVAILDGRLVRLKDFDGFAEGDLLHVLLPRGFPPAQILALAGTPLRLDTGHAARRLPLAAWLKARGPACRAWLSARAGHDADALPGQDPAAEPADLRITVRHLSQGPAGVLHLLALDDPARLVRRVVLERQGNRIELTPQHGADGTALLAGLADLPGGGGTCRIRALHHSGRSQILADAPVVDHDGGIPPGFEDAWTLGADVLEPLARARAGFRRAAPPSVAQHFGPAQPCGLRIVTSIGDSADLIRARAALILAEYPPTPVEVVCTMTEGPLAIAARHALAQTAAIYGIPHRLVLLPGLATAGERLCAALAEARDVPALVLGADVLPQAPGWLAFWLRRLRRQGALAPALLAADGSIAATREGDDPCRGLPVAHLPPSGRMAGRPLADCLALAPAGIARLLDGTVPHPDPAVWIARALQGAARTETRFPFRRFGPAAVRGGFAAALSDAEFALIGKDRP